MDVWNETEWCYDVIDPIQLTSGNVSSSIRWDRLIINLSPYKSDDTGKPIGLYVLISVVHHLIVVVVIAIPY